MIKMKKVIRYSNNAKAYSDVMCLQLAKAIVKELQEDKNLDMEFSYSNQVFLDCIRAEILKVDYRLNNKVKWLVENTEVHFSKLLRSSDIWDFLPNISEQCIETILGGKEYVEDSNASM